MFKPRPFTFILITLLFWSCKTDNKYNYAIKDFRKSLQPYLTNIVSKRIVTYYDSSLRSTATDKELIQLGQSEHPALRASAFREMLQRKSFNHLDVLMSHLDDTAVIATEAGEWGIWYRTVSDNMIEDAKWKDSADKNKTVDEVITKHNYLRSAYTILSTLPAQEKYYPFVKDMTIRENKSIIKYNKQWVPDIEFALYGLAKFKKQGDVKIIKDLLISSVGGISDYSFKLMTEFPDSSYVEVFEAYYPKSFYRNICIDNNVYNAVNFIQSVATYKNDRSAKILETILNRKPFLSCGGDSSELKHKLIYAIWGNPCDAYIKLRRQIEWQVKEDEKNRITLPPVDEFVFPEDKAIEKIKW